MSHLPSAVSPPFLSPTQDSVSRAVLGPTLIHAPASFIPFLSYHPSQKGGGPVGGTNILSDCLPLPSPFSSPPWVPLLWPVTLLCRALPLHREPTLLGRNPFPLRAPLPLIPLIQPLLVTLFPDQEMMLTGRQPSWLLAAHTTRPCQFSSHHTPLPSHPSSEEEEESEGSSSYEGERDDHWQKGQRQTVKELDWTMAAKIQAAQVQYQRGANPKWECLSNGEMKEQCKTAKDFGRRSPNFNNVFLRLWQCMF